MRRNWLTLICGIILLNSYGIHNVDSYNGIYVVGRFDVLKY